MAEFKEQINFSGGMNWDDPLRRVPKGDYRTAKNIRRRGDAIHNIKGSTELANLAFPEGEYMTIGVCRDKVKNRVIEFICDTTGGGNHAIVRLNCATNTRHIVEMGPHLNFTTDPLFSAVIGDSVVFANKANPPREINVDKVEASTASLCEFNLSFIRYAPTLPMVATPILDFAVPRDLLKYKRYQFTHRYVYKDGSKSTLAPYTRFVSCNHDFQLNKNVILLDIQDDIWNSRTNTRLTKSNPVYQLEIAEVEIMVRNNSNENFRTVTRIPAGTSTFFFKDEAELGPVPVSESTPLFHSVPRVAEDVAIKGNRVFFGNNTEDFPEVTGLDIQDASVQLTEPDDPDHPVLNPAFDTTFKTNSKYQLALEFRDEAGRFPLLYTHPNLIFDTTSANLSAFVSLKFKFGPGFVPPSWAKSFSVLRSNSLDTNWFIQGICNWVNFKKMGGYDSEGKQQYFNSTAAEASFLIVDIANFYSATKQSATHGNPDSKLYYTYQQGDKIRIGANKYNVAFFEDNKFWINAEEANARSFTPEQSYLIEVYRESAVNPEGIIFYEMGEDYLINGGAWGKTDFLITNGDVYHRQKDFWFDVKSTTEYYRSSYVQAMSPYKDHESGAWDHATGRAAVTGVDKPSVKNLKTQVRHGGLLIPETKVNNLFVFSEFDQYVYPLEFGSLRKLVPAGDVMLGLFDHKVISIYIGRNMIETPDGGQQLALTNKILGTFNELQGAFGCQNPESAEEHEGRVWFWSQSAGSWIRYSQNGLTELSRYKMRDYFRTLNQGLVRASFDPKYDELICKHTAGVIVFEEHEERPRWRSFRNYHEFDILVPGYGFAGAWASTLETNSETNKFFGSRYDSEIQPVVSEPGTENKVPLTMDIDADKVWCPVQITSDNGLATTTSFSKMEQREWIWSCPVGFATESEKRVRGRAFSVLLRLDPNCKVPAILYDIFVNYQHSTPQIAK